MKLKVQEIIAGVALLLATLFALSNTFHYLNWIKLQGLNFFEMATESLSGFIMVVATLVPIPIPLVTALAALMVFTRARKMAVITSIAAPILIMATHLITFIWFLESGLYKEFYFRVLKDVLLGKTDVYIYRGGGVGPIDFPLILTFILMCAAVVLLMISKHDETTEPSALDIPTPISQSAPQPFIPPQAPTAPAVMGMKKCPECAELIQGEAVKCRFCGYRYPKAKTAKE